MGFIAYDQMAILFAVFLLELLCGAGSVRCIWNLIRLLNWATLLIFGTFCGVIFRSVAQFSCLIFEYIMPPKGTPIRMC